MDIENYKMSEVDGFKRITFDVTTHNRGPFTVFIQGTDYGCSEWTIYKGKKVDMEELAQKLGYSDDEYGQLEDYIDGQNSAVYSFNN